MVLKSRSLRSFSLALLIQQVTHIIDWTFVAISKTGNGMFSMSTSVFILHGRTTVA